MLCMWTHEHFNKIPNVALAHIESALEFGNGERILTNVIEDLIAGSKQIWLGTVGTEFVATVVTQVIDYPSGKRTCEICYLGGEKGSGVMAALGEVKEIEDWAVANKCDDMQIFGRRGWLKALKEHGYSDRYTILGKSLNRPTDNKEL